LAFLATAWLLVEPTVQSSITAFSALAFSFRRRYFPPPPSLPSFTIASARAIQLVKSRHLSAPIPREEGRRYSLCLRFLCLRAAASLGIVPRQLCAATHRAAASAARARRTANYQYRKTALLSLFITSSFFSPVAAYASLRVLPVSALSISCISCIRCGSHAEAVAAWANQVGNWSRGLHRSAATTETAIQFCVHLERLGQPAPPAAVSFYPLSPPPRLQPSPPPLPSSEPPPPLWPLSPPELPLPPAFSPPAPIQHLPCQVMPRPRMATAADGTWDLTFFDANGHCLFRKKKRPPPSRPRGGFDAMQVRAHADPFTNP
jgi:hypothetical protein